MIATILLACGVFALLRSAGTTGDAAAEFAWRWTETSEDRLLRASDEPPRLPSGHLSARAAAVAGTEWPGFRGAGRDGVLPGVRLDTNWSLSPPVELWRRPIGPGASSFAASKDLLYTQEQRGDDEVVSCYEVTTGAPVWTQPLGTGPIPTGFTGPVPLVAKSSVYLHNPLTQTMTALSALTGAVQWQTPISTPEGKFSWGPSVVVGNKLIVPAGPDLYTFDARTGAVLSQLRIGGSFTYNNPTVAGKTLYIGNSWGWVSALPLDTVTGAAKDN